MTPSMIKKLLDMIPADASITESIIICKNDDDLGCITIEYNLPDDEFNSTYTIKVERSDV